MTYRLTMVVRNQPGFDAKVSDGPTRNVTTRIGGCVDDADAKSKARALYDVEAFRKIEEVVD